MDKNNMPSFDGLFFEMIKEAIKQASVEMFIESQQGYDISQKEMEKQLNEIIAEVEEPKTLTIDRMQEIVEDYRELGEFAGVMDEIGFFNKPKDVIDLLIKPNLYKKLYLLWVELGRPNKKHEMFEKFGQAVWSRETKE
jgi:hypothetical protein